MRWDGASAYASHDHLAGMFTATVCQSGRESSLSQSMVTSVTSVGKEMIIMPNRAQKSSNYLPIRHLVVDDCCILLNALLGKVQVHDQ